MATDQQGRSAARWVMAGLIALAAGAKIAHGWRNSMMLPEWAFYTSAVTELAIASLFVGAPRLGAAAAAIFFSLGLLWALMRNDGDCGCLGSISMARRQQIVLCCLGLAGAALTARSSISADRSR